MAMVVTIDLGMGIYRNMQVQGAAQSGAEYAATHGFNAGAITNAIAISTPLTGLSASTGAASILRVRLEHRDRGRRVRRNLRRRRQGRDLRDSLGAERLPDNHRYPLLPGAFTLTAQSTVRLQ